MINQSLLQQQQPNRQGELYRMNLLSRQCDGPYLKKDIMSDNKKSMTLLTGGRSVLQSLSSFNNSMVMLQSKTKQITNLLPQNINNLTSTYQYCQEQLSIMFAQSSRLQRQEKQLKLQLSKIYDQQKASQQDLYNQCMPLLKNLMKSVKQGHNHQKEQYHLIQREISMIQMTKKVLVHGIIQCENRIVNLEELIGEKTVKNQLD